MGRPALFLDRDGVINVDHGYVHRIDQVDFVPDIEGLIRCANTAGWLVVIATNQAGIARGYYTQEQFESFMQWMIGSLGERGAHIDAVYHCPYHPEGQGLFAVSDHPDRKPNPGMLMRAARDLDIDLTQSALIGDQPSDLEAAQRAGIPHRGWFGQVETRHQLATALVDHRQSRAWLAALIAEAQYGPSAAVPPSRSPSGPQLPGDAGS